MNSSTIVSIRNGRPSGGAIRHEAIAPDVIAMRRPQADARTVIERQDASSRGCIGTPLGGAADLLSPAKRRRAVEHVRDVLGRDRLSERRACLVSGKHRNMQRWQRHVPDDEPRLVQRIVWLAREHGRYGYRRMTALLHWEGWRVNHKRVERRRRPGALLRLHVVPLVAVNLFPPDLSHFCPADSCEDRSNVNIFDPAATVADKPDWLVEYLFGVINRTFGASGVPVLSAATTVTVCSPGRAPSRGV